MLKVASENVKNAGLERKITVRKGEITKTGYPDETFDMILCEHALFLFKNPDVVVREPARVLKKESYNLGAKSIRAILSLVIWQAEHGQCGSGP
jgi:ubiquinone/menaquinone biosynthesis C-methylase UbiE